MMRAAYNLVFAGVCAAGLAGCAHGFRAVPGEALAIPRGNPVEADIAAGYREYGALLERWGRWSRDPLYSMHWCPRGVDAETFIPYASAGHWAPPLPGGTDSPYWTSDDADTWGDITMHHGWWIQLDAGLAAGVWCWVPGAEETTARVVWEEADGFVAWAPEPPMYDGDADALLVWSSVLLGTLFDGDLSRALLWGDPAQAAAYAINALRHLEATHPGRAFPRRHTAPSAATVANARRALTSYVAAHPVVASAEGSRSPAVQGGVSGTSTSGTPASGSSTSSGESTSTAHTSTTASTSSTSSSHTSLGTEDPLPPSVALYTQIVRDPFAGTYVGGPAPYFPFAASAQAAAAAGHGSFAGSAAPKAYSYAPPSTPSHAKGTSSSSHSSGSSSSSHSHSK